MRAARVFGAFAALASFIACNAQPGVEIDLGTGEQAITNACSYAQIGAPCDPDGSGGPLQECQGVCALRGTGGGFPSIQCVTLATAGLTNNNGKLCGSSGAGVGNCNRVCDGTLCVAKPAPAGTACRPGTAGTDSLCDGQCEIQSDGTGSCVRITSGACPIERAIAGGFNINDCGWNFCSATSAKTCVVVPIPSGITCNDGNACTTSDRCNGAGKCIAGTTRTCPASGTPCLSNACDPATGGCVATPTTAACTFDRCFAGTCSGGVCNKGAPVDCNDGNACTVDACDATLGCTHAAKACPAPDACTISVCNPSSGSCANTARSCDDGNPCTSDSCNPSSGCVNIPIPGCLFDAGVDTGPPPPIDTGVPPIDTGVEPTDTDVEPTDTDVTFDDGPIEEDTGIPGFDTGIVVDSGDDSATDAGEGGLGLDEDLSRGGCGCRTTGSSSSTTGVALAGLMAALVVARRRRR